MTWPSQPSADPSLSGPEPEGLGEAVEAAAVMLALVTAFACVGFQWQRNAEQAAHRFAVDLTTRIARHGEEALVPVWSGFGRGPASETARDTFRALQALGNLVPAGSGRCHVASRFAVCSGTRYSCRVTGATPAGPVEASIGLCRTSAGAPFTFDSFDLKLPPVGNDAGNREDVDIGRDGLIRYGTTPLPSDILPVRLHRRASPPWP